ncbi:hypothetical protein ABPG74_008829 [Tetrahymena malaccensis]
MRYLQKNYYLTPYYKQFNMTIYDCVFQDNLSLKNGGGLYLKSFPALITFTKFVNNTAKQNGGAIYSDDNINSLLESFQSIYEINQAQNGGGIYSKSGNSITEQQKNIFYKNIAFKLNNDVYSSPTQMIVRVNNNIYKNQDKQILFSINNHFSGVLNQEVIIQLVNNDGAVYTEFENNPLLNLSIIQGKASLSTSFISQKKGIFNFTEQVNIQGYFGEKYLLMITSDSIKIPIGQNQVGQIIYQKNYQKIIEINMIQICSQGYIPKKNIQGYDLCIQCPQGTYSLDPTQSSCQQCPLAEANCYGNVIELPQGYWRSSKNTAQIYPCFQSLLKCIGDNTSLSKSLAQFRKTQTSLTYYCNRGYVGAICDDCDYNSMYWDSRFYKTSYNSCNQCRESKFINTIIYLGVFVVYSASLCYYSTQMLEGVQQNLLLNVLKYINPRLRSLSIIPSLSLWVKLLFNYVQIIFYILDVRSNNYGSFYLINFFQAPFIVPIDELSCTLNEQFSNVQIPFKNLFYYFFSCVIMLLGCFLVFKTLSIFRSKIMKIYLLNVQTIFILFYFNISFFIKTGIQTLNCKVYDGKYYVSSNLSLECTSIYLNQAFIYFSIVIFLSFVPIIAAIYLLYQKRYQLNKFKYKKYLGFFSMTFNQEHYYWDFIILIEKAFLVTFSELFSDNENCRLALINIILISFTFLQKQNKPFFNQYFNTFDSQISNLLVAVCSLKMIILNSSSAFFNNLFLVIISLILFLIAYLFINQLECWDKLIGKCVAMSLDEYIGISFDGLCIDINNQFDQPIKKCFSTQFIKTCISPSNKSCIVLRNNDTITGIEKMTQKCLFLETVINLNQILSYKQARSNCANGCLQLGNNNLEECFCTNISKGSCYECPQDYCSFSNLNKCLTGQDTIKFIGKGNCVKSVNSNGLCKIVSIQISEQNQYDLCSDINGFCQIANNQNQNSCLQCPQQYYYNPGILKCYTIDEANKQFNQNNKNFIFGLNIQYVQDDCYDNNNCLSDSSKKCPKGCFSCTSKTYCTQCIEGYFLQKIPLNNQQQCVFCPQIQVNLGQQKYSLCVDCSSELDFWPLKLFIM